MKYVWLPGQCLATFFMPAKSLLVGHSWSSGQIAVHWIAAEGKKS